MAVGYKFRNVPKVFKTREQAVAFLQNSPGYVKRQENYLKTYWPGLYDQIAKPSLAARGPNVKLGEGSKLGTNLAGAAKGATVAVGHGLANDIRSTLGTMQSGGGPVQEQNPLPASVQKAVNVAQPASKRLVKTTSQASDFTLGKGIPNLIQGQGPKNWQDTLGLVGSAATIFPVFKGITAAAKTGKALKAGIAAEDAAKAAKAADEAIMLGGPKTINETVQAALEGVDPAIDAQLHAYSVEKAIRAKGAMKAYYDAGGGTAGRNAALGELKGALPVVNWGGFTEFTPETVSAMISHIFERTDLHNLQFWEMVSASKGLDRVVAGRSPQRGQKLLLERAFGKETADALSGPENRTLLRWLYDAGVKIWNIPRTIMASYDLSAPFRQGLVAGARHPVIFAKNFTPMVKAFGSEKVARSIMDDIPTRANFQRYGIGKLDIHVVEEQFPGSYVDNWVGIKQSARAYVAFLHKMRVDMFDRVVAVAEKNGKNIDDPDFLKALGEYVNTSTGRGRIPGKHGEDAAEALNTFLFSPRLLASRFQILNPVYYARLYKMDPFVARQAMQAAAQTIGGISTMVYLASNIPGAKVGLNPLSSDFGKVRIGDTRVDFAGGFQPLIVLYSRLYKKKSVSSTTGKSQDINGGYGSQTRPDVVYRFFQSKLAPTTKMIWERAAEQTYLGDPVTVKGQVSSMAPLTLQQTWSSYQSEGIAGAVAAGLLSGVGFGVGSYPDAPSGSGAGGRPRSGGSNRPGSSRSNSGRGSNRP